MKTNYALNSEPNRKNYTENFVDIFWTVMIIGYDVITLFEHSCYQLDGRQTAAIQDMNIA